jgi:hypothetical protein
MGLSDRAERLQKVRVKLCNIHVFILYFYTHISYMDVRTACYAS